MFRLNFDRGWKLRSAATSNGWWNRQKEILVDLPHDYSISLSRDPRSLSGASSGFFPGGVINYEKNLFVPEEWKGKKLILEFEGVYMNATVHFNHQIVACNPYGYTSFLCDLSSYLVFGRENIIRITVNNNALPNTRWYSGTGMYRHVWLLMGEAVHLAPWGIFATTPEVSSDKSLISVKTVLENTSVSDKTVKLKSTLLDALGNERTSAESLLDIEGLNTCESVHLLDLAPTCLWSVEQPYLYTLRSEVIKGGKVIDSSETKVGVRSISFDAEKGFQLNGITMKLKGGCVHHDCGLLGAAAYDRAEERKVELLKASGFNAVRCAHNPPSPAFLDACDRLGMLVIDEAFDCWRESKNPNDYGMYFENWWERDIASMVLRDRNHPSVILWSTGNEIIERDGRSKGYEYARRLADYVRSLDDTRGITNALNNIGPDPLITGLATNLLEVSEGYDHWGNLTSGFVEPLDVVGYNYLRDRYASDGEKFPGRVICGTETFPYEAFDYWEATESNKQVIGDFVWTSLDYLGEAGIGRVHYDEKEDFLGDYPWHQAFCGDIDICGFKRPQSYYRDCVWGVSKAPYIAVHKLEHHGETPRFSPWGWPDVVLSWTWPGFKGKPCIIDVYCQNSEVELVLNGRSLGRKSAGKVNRYIASYETVYEPGELVAIAHENGNEIARTVLKTAETPAALRLIPDRTILKAEFGDLSYVTVELLDVQGNVVHNADTEIYFTVCGKGTLLAVGTGNPVSEENYTGHCRRVYEGHIMAVVRAEGDAGEITLTAAAEGIPAETVTIQVK